MGRRGAHPLRPVRRVKALTLWQPWASMVAAGVKRAETRSWGTSYRGELAIHAAAEVPALVRRSWATLDHALWRARVREGARREVRAFVMPKDLRTMPLGHVLAVVELLEVRRVQVPGACPFEDLEDAGEALFGDYSTTDRFVWSLRLLRVFPFPISARGRQGLWEWTPARGILIP